jgi:hypothetical protein
MQAVAKAVPVNPVRSSALLPVSLCALQINASRTCSY